MGRTSAGSKTVGVIGAYASGSEGMNMGSVTVTCKGVRVAIGAFPICSCSLTVRSVSEIFDGARTGISFVDPYMGCDIGRASSRSPSVCMGST